MKESTVETLVLVRAVGKLTEDTHGSDIFAARAANE